MTAEPQWAKGYRLDHLRALCGPFKHQHEPHVYGAFGLIKERDVATALENHNFYWFDQHLKQSANAVSAAIMRRLSTAGRHTDFRGRVIKIPAGRHLIGALAVRNNKVGERLVKCLLENVPDGLCWAEIFEEDVETKTVLENNGFYHVATKVLAGSEIKGLYQNGHLVEKKPQADDFTVGTLKTSFLSARELKDIETELWEYGDKWAQHYSSYNKRHSWTAFALRGYDPKDPGFIIYPEEMSRAWKEENPERLTRKPGWTPAAKHFPRTLEVVKRVHQLVDSAYVALQDSDLLRVRFMRLAAKGELSRHADITDRFAGTADGHNVRLHIPIKTSTKVKVQGWDARGRMIEVRFNRGALCYLDTRKPHRVVNTDPEAERIHLVVDIKSSRRFRELVVSKL